MATDGDKTRAGQALAKARVLVVEPDIETARNLVRVLMRKGYDVQHAEDPENALNAIRGSHPKVILIDATLPRKTGLQLGRDIRALPNGQATGLIMISSSFKSGTIERDALRVGFDAVFPKPIPVLDLLAKVDEYATKGRAPPTVASPAKTEARPVGPARHTGPPVPAKAASTTPKSNAGDATPSRATPIPKSAVGSSAPAEPSAEGRAVAVPSSSSFAAPPKTNPDAKATSSERAPSKPPPSPVPITATDTALSMLLSHARLRSTGVVRLRNGAAFLEIALKNGVPVGAWDNLRENRLVERLQRTGAIEPNRIPLIEARMRESNERFIEACLALGILDETSALDALFAQLCGRVETAVFWASGTLAFVDDARAVEDLAHWALDIVEVALLALLRHPERSHAEKLLAEHTGTFFVPTLDFEPQLSAIGRAHPNSILPQLFLSGRVPFAAVAQNGMLVVDELAAWLRLGLVRGEDAPLPKGTLPVLLRSERESTAFDLDAARIVRETYLRWQGRTHYDVLGVARDASKEEVREAVAERHRTVGRSAFTARELGPAHALRRELVVMIDSAGDVLTDDDERADYDLSLESALSFPRATAGHALEEEILQGRIYLANGNLAGAYDAFMRACALAPTDVDAVAYLGYVTFIGGRDTAERARLILESALEMNPQATRPVFYLGLIDAQEGRVDEARERFLTAARRAPEDQKVLAALAALDGASE
jgi:CheY-like chemotaxis protein/tetratricopeptide (TPR) repeat protein